jgi:sulfite exporter TauE/SafE
MIALVVAVFTASVLGSLHCVGMCGAFVALAVSDTTGGSSRFRLITAYNLGRLVTYTILGALAGLLGAAVDLGGEAVGVQRVAAGVAGGLMVGFGLITLARIHGVKTPRLPAPTIVQRFVMRGHQFAQRRTPVARATLIGLLTTLLPCGWLYAFAITAAGTGDPFLGALTMAVFWAGTLPALVALGAGVQRLAGLLGSYLPTATTCAVVAVGLWMVSGRMHMPSMHNATPAVTVSHDEDGHTHATIEYTTPGCCTVDSSD